MNKPRYPLTPLAILKTASEQHISNLQVLVLGRVAMVLPDDDEGDRHQRFILELPNEHTILVVHNIDMTPRVSDLQVGDAVCVHGEYEWNYRGGLIHWTHHDPDGEHLDGWIERNGEVFE
ncbi:MAG: DUF3465 domain-containing protein [Cyanobacteria bacterium P01_A01_bin.37]